MVEWWPQSALVTLSLRVRSRVYNCEPGSHVNVAPNPLGTVAVLTAFNFPVAVYGWYGQFIGNFV